MSNTLKNLLPSLPKGTEIAKLWTQFIECKSGATAIEYAILSFIVGGGFIGALEYMSDEHNEVTCTISSTLAADGSVCDATTNVAQVRQTASVQTTEALAPVVLTQDFDFTTHSQPGEQRIYQTGDYTIVATVFASTPNQLPTQAPGRFDVYHDGDLVGTKVVSDIKSPSPAEVTFWSDGEGNWSLEGYYLPGNIPHTFSGTV